MTRIGLKTTVAHFEANRDAYAKWLQSVVLF